MFLYYLTWICVWMGWVESCSLLHFLQQITPSVIILQHCTMQHSHNLQALVSCRVATKIFEGFGEALFMEFIKGREPVSTTLGLEPVSIIHYTRSGSSIPNYLATQRHVNWPVVYPESSYKIMDLRRIFVATLVSWLSRTWRSLKRGEYSCRWRYFLVTEALQLFEQWLI